MDSDVTYAEVGASRADPMPAGYRHLRYKTLVGHGAETMRAAADSLLSMEMHRAVGLRSDVDGDVVRQRIGPIEAPCRILFRESTPERAGFTYGTLPGHPVCGEETFRLTHEPDDLVWLEVRSFSRPANWATRLAGPILPLLQREFARRCGRALRGIRG